MKILKARRVVATSKDKDKMPQCSFCNEKGMGMFYTTGKKLVCNQCVKKDGEIEYVDEI
jgi:hypothetical protein